MNTKICQGECKRELPETEEFFYFRKDRGKFRNECSDCIKNQRKDFYIDNREQILRNVSDYQDNNKEKISKKRKSLYEENREERLKKQKEYNNKNKLQKKEYDKFYRKKNKQIITKKDKIRKTHLRKTNKNFRLLSNLRRRIHSALQGINKSKRTLKLLGCSINELRKYLESQFVEGMSWDNHGRGCDGKGLEEWHIDHIKPCSKFDLSKKSEQLKCFNFTNLQPLWAEENLRKGNN